jgi:hypothetical protein
VASALGVRHDDARILPLSHLGLVSSHETGRLAASFLATGSFDGAARVA